jgi:hypothetical protein
MSRRLVLLVSLTLVVKCELVVFGADFSPEDVVAAVSAATTAIETVECRFRVFHAQTVPSEDDPVDEATGWGIYSEFDWGWERSTGRETQQGSWNSSNKNSESPKRNDWTIAYNGRVLKTFSHDGNGGEVAPVQTFFTNWVSPLIFFGRDIGFSPTVRSLPELLQGATLLESAEADLLILRSEFEDGPGEDPRHELRVWVDATKGFSPKRIEVREMWSGQIKREYDVEDVKEVAPGVWFPLRARRTFYAYEDVIEPEGVGPEAIQGMSQDEIDEFVATNCKFVMKPLGFGTELYVTLPETIRVNHRIADETFEFEFPPGSRYDDKFTGERVDVPGGTSTEAAVVAPSSSARSKFRNLLVVGSLAVMCLVLLWWSRNRRTT